VPGGGATASRAADKIRAKVTSAYSFALGNDQSTNLTGIGKDYICMVTHHAGAD
jgi:hypothetical protein